jgi:hypothetical protein
VGAGDKYLSWNSIPPDASSNNDFARIIIGIDVPNIAVLSADSSKYQVITPEESKNGPRADAINADMALENAIGQAADLVLFALDQSDYKIIRRYSAFPFIAISVNQKAFEALKSNPGVISTEIDMPVPLPLPVSDDGPKDATGASFLDVPKADEPLANLNWGPPKIGADTAWAMGYTGAGWYVAILDTGIRRTHEFFTGKTIVEACFSSAANCPGGTTSSIGPGSAVHYPSTYSGYDHGTHVSGIAAGWKSDGSVAGVAKNSNIIAVQIFSKLTCSGSPCVSSYNSDSLAGLNHVYSLRNTYSIAAINLSIGDGVQNASACDSDSRKAAIDSLRNVGIATAIATGNDKYCAGINAPACISSSIAVSSSTSSDQESSFNNWSSTLTTLFAPGSSVYSSTGASDTSYASWNGTSMATPHVTGTWAILRQNRPTDSVSTIRSRVLSGGVAIVTGCGGGLSKPRVYIPNALISTPTPTGVSTLLWAETTGRASIWTLDVHGNRTGTIYYGPYTGWAPRSYHRNSDGTANMLWGRTGGYVSLWAAIDASGNPTSKLYFGPYPDWTAMCYNKNSGGTANMLWGRTDGLTALWMMDASNNRTDVLYYGPYPGWTAKSYHGNSDGTANMLWGRTDGFAALWVMNGSGGLTDILYYGPYADWAAKSFFRNSNGTGRMLWGRTYDGYVSLWMMDASGNPTSKVKYGPYAGWAAIDYD